MLKGSVKMYAARANGPARRMIIIDKNKLFPDMLIAALQGREKKVAVVNLYREFQTAIHRLHKDAPDFIVADIEGITGEVREMFLAIRKKSHADIIVVTEIKDVDVVFAAFEGGAIGYVLKESSAHEMIAAGDFSEKGGAPLSNTISKMLVYSFRKNPASPLSARETEVLDLMAKGKSFKEIGVELMVSAETVNNHARTIYQKLKVNTRAEALLKASRQHYIV